jgi:hypothetical protein
MQTLIVILKVKVASKGDSSTKVTPPYNTIGSNTNRLGVIIIEVALSIAVIKEAASSVIDNNNRSR